MACIKGINRSAMVALSPESPYMAAGTMAGAVDLSFSSSANLEIYKLDFQSDDHELPLICETTCSERFNRLSWGKKGLASEQFGLGLIAGGFVDGTISIWNPLTLISPKSSENALVKQLLRHKGPVRGLEFNSIAPHLLASGADDGEIGIWDLTAPTEPNHYPPLKGSGSAAQGEISFLSWNSKVQNILASTSYNGNTVVWDLKKQKPVISFQDPVRRRCSVLQWNPEVATQLFVASDDDNYPSLRLWDMRNTLSPVKELVGHTKGVISMSWCPSDSRYLLTCAKDNRTICWDTISGEIVCELPNGTNWNFDIHWYQKIPGVILASSFDGKIGIYNIEGCSRYGLGESEFSPAPLRAPKWYKRPAGVSFGFGGKIIYFHQKSSPAAPGEPSEVYMNSLVTEDSLVNRSSEFEAAIQNGDRSSLRVLCEQKSQESKSDDDRETWGFLKVMFEEDGTARTKLLTHLGFSLPVESKDDLEEEVSKEVKTISLEETSGEQTVILGDNATIFASDNGEDFFNNLPSPKAETPVSTSADHFVVGDTVLSGDEIQQDLKEHEKSADPSFDDAVQRALVVGDYKDAVAKCLSADKIADALVIAHVGGASLWESTRDQYLKKSQSPYLKVVSAMVNNDLTSLVHTRPLKFWKETLALLCSFAQRDEWTSLCDTLASKLMTVGNTLAATLCFICAGNIDKAVEIWSRSLAGEEGKPYVDLLQDLMEKTIVFALATGQKRFSASICKLVEKYTEILASQGLLTTAMEYLKLLGSDELSPELLILRDRLSLAKEPEIEEPKPAFEHSQLNSGSVYGSDQPSYGEVETSQHYFQETAPSQVPQSVSTNPYGEKYQQQPFGSYLKGGYATPAPYQPAPQPKIFVPSQAPTPQAGFAPQLTTPQPTVRPFVPATPTMLRNAEQYQKPTLGSQLYPGTSNPTYQPGLPPAAASLGPITSQVVSGSHMPQVMAPTHTPRGFVPVNSTASILRPGPGPMQPPSPTQKHVLPPAQSAPASTVQTVDTSNVPAHQMPVVTTLTRLFHETSEAVGGARANPAKKREIEDNSRKIGALFAKLNSGYISKNAADNLIHLCKALDNGDFGTALKIQVQLTTSDWDECNFWLATLKRMIKARQNIRF